MIIRFDDQICNYVRGNRQMPIDHENVIHGAWTNI